jgi:phage recombination protein Bet
MTMSAFEDRTGTDVAQFQKPRLPYDGRLKDSFGVDRAGWKALVEAVFPLAKSVDSIALALSYCKARKLDPFKRAVHIVPMWDNGKRKYVDTIWPGIAELRITAHRTGEYAGCDETEFGAEMTETFKGHVKDGDAWKQIEKTVTFPEWARVTVYRHTNGRLAKFVGPRVKWLETYATIGKSDVPNDMWEDRAEGQVEKCAEAAALRKAFPEELGNEYSAEEMEGKRLNPDIQVQETPAPQAQAAKPRRLMTLNDIAEETSEPPVSDRAPPPSRDQPPLADLPPSAGGPSEAQEAYARGKDAFRAGRGPVIPPEYKGKPALVAAWKKGWEDARAQDDGGIDE